MFAQILAVGFGGFLGAVSRFLLVQAAGVISPIFPVGTLLVNVIGSFFAGFILYSISPGKLLTPEWRHFLNIGFLGAFTTMSAFAYETILLADQKNYIGAGINIGLTVVLTLIGVLAGRWCAARFMQ